MRDLAFVLVMVGGITISIAQSTRPLSVAISTHQPSLPGQNIDQLFSSPFHPGLTVGTNFSLNQDSTHQLLETAKLGYFYHEYNQQALQLYSEFSYRLRFHAQLQGVVRVGAGYLHSFPRLSAYTATPRGDYRERSNWGRPQLMLTTSIGLQYFISSTTRLFVEYQGWGQYPFVQQYVPLLPYTAFHIGLHLPLSLSKKTSHENR